MGGADLVAYYLVNIFRAPSDLRQKSLPGVPPQFDAVIHDIDPIG